MTSKRVAKEASLALRTGRGTKKQLRSVSGSDLEQAKKKLPKLRRVRGK